MCGRYKGARGVTCLRARSSSTGKVSIVQRSLYSLTLSVHTYVYTPYVYKPHGFRRAPVMQETRIKRFSFLYLPERVYACKKPVFTLS